jgi:hypothetical protein
MRALDKLNAYVTGPGARFPDPPNPAKVTRIGHRSKNALLKQKSKHPAG